MAKYNCGTLSNELNAFIYGVSRRNFQNAPDLTRTAVSLLQNFPASRDAVLDYFSTIFHEALGMAIQPEFDSETSSTPPIEAVAIISESLCQLDDAWASIVTPWSISLLKDIAGSKANYSLTAIQNTEPVRALLNIATASLTRLSECERAKCIDMMLGSSQCEWVVGYLGRSDPWLVVPRALRLGIRNDARHNVQHAVGVLAHLSTVHAVHIHQALLDLFNESLDENNKLEKRGEIIPYLLHLASKSDTVLTALTKDIESLLTESVVLRLSQLCSAMANTPAWESVTPALLVTLCLRSEATTFSLILSWATKNTYCRQLLEHLLQKLEFEVRSSSSKIPLMVSIGGSVSSIRSRLVRGSLLEQYAVARVLILLGYQSPAELVNTVSYLLLHSRRDGTLALLVRIVSGTLGMRASMGGNGSSGGEEEESRTLLVRAVQRALQDARVADTRMRKALVQSDHDDNPPMLETYLERYCKNITTLLRWESTNKVIHLRSKPISFACEANLLTLAGVFSCQASLLHSRQPGSLDARASWPACHALAAVLERTQLAPSGGAPSAELLIKMVQANVKYFFRCLHETDLQKQMLGTHTAYKMFRKLCLGRAVARAVALRELLEGALFRETDMFGARSSAAVQNNENFERTKDELLIFQNRKHGPITQLTQSHTSVFHAGIIGKGARRMLPEDDRKAGDMPPRNTKEIELLMGALMACMEGSSGVVEGMTSVSLLLVELITPDVMYNGLPWPDEDFSKVSIERELYMRAAWEGCPAARAALRRSATARPALCYASALLRAVASTLMHQYTAKSERYMGMEHGNLNSVTTELLESMFLGQLLPHPLNYITEMLPSLKPNEIVQILRECLWNYTRDVVPSPALFTCDSTGVHWREPSLCRPPPAYTDALRIAIQRNVATLGHLYPLMFLSLAGDAEQDHQEH